MNSFRKHFIPILISSLFLLVAGLSFADDPAVPLDQFLPQLFDFIKSFGGLPAMAKVSGVILLFIASMKVTFFKPMWNRLGSAQAFAAPVLGLLFGIFTMGSSLSLPGIAAYTLSGAGAVFFHEILDSLKGLPWIGPFWVSAIDMIEKIPVLGSKS